MGKIEEAMIRHWLKPDVTCNLPGRMRMTFRSYKRLPKEAQPYLHYIRDILTLLPGVSDVQINARIGTVLVLYEPKQTSSEQILDWVSTVVEAGLELYRETDWQQAASVSEEEWEKCIRARLVLRLPQVKEG